jgi:hypothetical protein
VAKDMFCPVCENTPLDTCPTAACQDWRDEIRAQLALGKSDAEIQQYFVDRYGPSVLSAPPREGFNLIIWLLAGRPGHRWCRIFARYLGGCGAIRGTGPPIPPLPLPRVARKAAASRLTRTITSRGSKRNCGNERNDFDPV